jgi:hypothetical protein
MESNMMEQMKKIIEEKRQKSAEQGYSRSGASKQIKGKSKGTQKAKRTKKSGGLFDK